MKLFDAWLKSKGIILIGEEIPLTECLLEGVEWDWAGILHAKAAEGHTARQMEASR